VFQEGKHFLDGGWFDTLTVQVRQGGVWTNVSALSISPAYPGNNGVNYETFEMTFTPATGDGIRIQGAPGGAADFVSIGELEVFAPAPEGSAVIAHELTELSAFPIACSVALAISNRRLHRTRSFPSEPEQASR